MGMTLDEIRLSRPDIELGPPDWSEYLRIIGVPPGFLNGADQAAFHVLVARLGGENVATAMAFDLAGDCGIYNVTTLQRARRRGLGTALTAIHLHDAHARGCQTASLQSTEMAERVYASAGFRDLGRILEYVPQTPTARGVTAARASDPRRSSANVPPGSGTLHSTKLATAASKLAAQHHVHDVEPAA
jgi:GNAT superfamily N-acetyltransferase